MVTVTVQVDENIAQRLQRLAESQQRVGRGRNGIELVYDPETEAQAESLAGPGKTLAPFGTIVWQPPAVKRLGRESSLRDPGRPCKNRKESKTRRIDMRTATFLGTVQGGLIRTVEPLAKFEGKQVYVTLRDAESPPIGSRDSALVGTALLNDCRMTIAHRGRHLPATGASTTDAPQLQTTALQPFERRFF